VSIGSFDFVALSEKLLDGLRFSRGLHDYEIFYHNNEKEGKFPMYRDKLTLFSVILMKEERKCKRMTIYLIFQKKSL
jgi:hypothetical protein